jgi:hypothetical protein
MAYNTDSTFQMAILGSVMKVGISLMPNAFTGGDHAEITVNLGIAKHSLEMDHDDAMSIDLANSVIIPANAGATVIPGLLEQAWSKPYVRECLQSGRSYYFEGMTVEQSRDGELMFDVSWGREIG